MKKKVKEVLQKSFKIFMIVGILLSSFPISPLISRVNALSMVSGDKIIEVAQSYKNAGYTYDNVGTCTGLVTRTLNKLGIGTSIVGIHPYDINKPQSEGGARYAPSGMYKNAMNHPEEAKLIFQGYVKDLLKTPEILKNGDLIIQRPEDKANPNGSGHVAFVHIYGNTISSFGANGSALGIGDIVLGTEKNDGDYKAIKGEEFVSIFRLTSAEPQYAKTSANKSADENVLITFTKTDVDTGKPLEGVEVDFYRDDVKFGSGITNSQGVAISNSINTFNASSDEKEYCTNYDDLDEEGRKAVDSRGAYHYLVDAQASADSEAQQRANDKASQTHRFSVVETKTKTKYWLDDDNKTVSDELTGSGNINVSLTNERVTATATLKKVDYDSVVAQNSAKLDGALYGLYARSNILDPADGTVLYKAGEEVARVRTTTSEVSVDNLYLGSYIWKEISSSEGYKLDLTEYPVELEYKGQNVKTVVSKTTVKEKVITGNFEVEKVITSGEQSEIVEKEVGAEFMAVAEKYVIKYGSIEEAWEHRNEFTDKEYDYLITNENGYAKSKDLAYGKIRVKQVKGKIDTDKVQDEWTFTVSKENQETIKYIINNRNFTSYVRLVKKDLETGKLITLSNTTFKIQDLETGEILTQKVGKDTFDTWTTDENAEFTLPLELKAKKYKLIELSSPDFYLMNNEGVEFTITNSNIIETDHDGDPLLTVTMYDKSVKGIINVEKHGETLTGVKQTEDGTYEFVYENKCIAGMTVEIQAREDIIDPADGSVLYEKGTIVDVVTTGNTCENYSEKLPLGKYTVYESIVPEGMVIDETKYDVDLTFKDNQTEVVMETVSITNERQKVSVNAVKLNKEYETPLAGVIFDLVALQDIIDPSDKDNILIKKDTIIETVKTDENGNLSFKSDLPLSFDDGEYFGIKEKESLNGFYLNDETFVINTKYQGYETKYVKNEFTIYNEPIKNYILVNKVDSLTMQNIISKDFSFKLCSDYECNSIIKTFNANQEDGTALIPITFGEWFIKEESAPLGYLLSDEVVKVSLNDEGLFVNDNKVETDEDLTYSIIYQNTLLPVIQTDYETNENLYLMIGCSSLFVVATVIVISKKRKRK